LPGFGIWTLGGHWAVELLRAVQPADGGLIATAVVGHDGRRGWVYYLAVVRVAQRQGHGRVVMAACEAWLAERDIPKLNLMMRAENHAARAFYAALRLRPRRHHGVLTTALASPNQARRRDVARECAVRRRAWPGRRLVA
jgi:GNAT superfamily N-acetyltransferase